MPEQVQQEVHLLGCAAKLEQKRAQVQNPLAHVQRKRGAWLPPQPQTASLWQPRRWVA